jgi:hypothetical protein
MGETNTTPDVPSLFRPCQARIAWLGSASIASRFNPTLRASRLAAWFTAVSLVVATGGAGWAWLPPGQEAASSASEPKLSAPAVGAYPISLPPQSRVGTRASERRVILRLARLHVSPSEFATCDLLADTIHSEAMAAGVDPLMVAAIVAKESSFRTAIVSPAGAVGLMQLRPAVAEDLALRRAIDWAGEGTLHAPQMNVRLGALYYRELLDRFDGNESMALTAYNFGPTRVSKDVREGTFAGSQFAAGVLQLYASLRNRELYSQESS